MRRYSVSRWSEDRIGIASYVGGVLTDADGDVLVDVVDDSSGVEVVTDAVADHDDVGLYSFVIPSSVTQTKGLYTAKWAYTTGGSARQFETEFEVVDPQPFWDNLTAEERQVVDNIYHKVSDTYDSTLGGPYLWELPQSTFSFETVARLLTVDAMTYINLTKPPAFVPPFSLGKDAKKKFPSGWYGLLEKAGYYELLKHLARSYLEQPDVVNVPTAYLDRGAYASKWRAEAESEKAELDQMLGQLKRSFRFSTHRSLLVAGGYFPMAWFNPARPRFPYVAARW